MTFVIAFTRNGALLADRLLCLLGEEGEGFAPERYICGGIRPLEGTVEEWTRQRFAKGNALIFVGAAGIAVRAIAPFIAGKEWDPAVICIDEEGRYVIPLLSGHMGGANRLAQEIAGRLGGRAVITTATDVNGVFAFDSWAAEQGFSVCNPQEIKEVSAAMLEGEMVGMVSDLPIDGPLPQGVREGRGMEKGVLLAMSFRKEFPHTLWLAPKCLWVGIGCRKGIGFAELEAFFGDVLMREALPVEAVEGLASIDRKQGEKAIVELGKRYGLPYRTFSADQLKAAEGRFSASAFVEQAVGVNNVCERAAMMLANQLLVPKVVRNGMTLAVGIRNQRVRFMAEAASRDSGEGKAP